MNQLTKTDNLAYQNEWINLSKQTIQLIKNWSKQIIQLTKFTKLDTPTYQTIQLTKQTNRPAKLFKSAYQIAKLIKSANSAHTVYLISHQFTVLPTL